MAQESTKAKSRMIDLSQVKHYNKNIKEAELKIEWREYVGETGHKGSEIISKAAKAQNLTGKPQFLKIVRSHRFPGDLCGVPTDEASEAHIPITWVDQGRKAKLSMPKLITKEKISIPRGTKMVISLYLEEEDPDFGTCVGMKLKDAEFVPIRPKKKPEEQEKKDETQGPKK